MRVRSDKSDQSFVFPSTSTSQKTQKVYARENCTLVFFFPKVNRFPRSLGKYCNIDGERLNLFWCSLSVSLSVNLSVSPLAKFFFPGK